MKVIKSAMAGTLESSDILVKIRPGTGEGVRIHVNSTVEPQFGGQIRATIEEVVGTFGIGSLEVDVDDKGALDCVIRARLQAAILRAVGDAAPDFSRLA